MKYLSIATFILILISNTFCSLSAQIPQLTSYEFKYANFDTTAETEKTDSEQDPYTYKFPKDLLITGANIGLFAYGFSQRESKEAIPVAEILELSPEDVNGFDRSATRHHSQASKKLSDVFLYSTSVMPLIYMAVDNNARKDIGKLFLLFIEAYSFSGMAYGLTAGLTDRKRPYAYNPEAEMSRRTSRHTRNSFLGGHAALSATGAFFFAKAFSDYYPNSPLKPFVWAVGVLAPLGTAYLRYDYGAHFPSDLIAGYLVGAASGYLVLHTHKKKEADKGMSFGVGGNGMQLSYRF
ncbi:MAG: phosphatase PAP2 family protein [Chitinophagales bacterium]